MVSGEMPFGNRYSHPSFAPLCGGEIGLEKAIWDCVCHLLRVVLYKYGQGLVSPDDFTLKMQKLVPGRKT